MNTTKARLITILVEERERPMSGEWRTPDVIACGIMRDLAVLRRRHDLVTKAQAERIADVLAEILDAEFERELRREKREDRA